MNSTPPEISNFFLAMQAGRAGAPTMAALFAEDAIYEEPFSGPIVTHTGRAAIMAVMEQGWNFPLPDIHLVIDRAETTAGRIAIDWTCNSPALPGGKGQGRNIFTLKDGKIVHLVTTLKGSA